MFDPAPKESLRGPSIPEGSGIERRQALYGPAGPSALLSRIALRALSRVLPREKCFARLDFAVERVTEAALVLKRLRAAIRERGSFLERFSGLLADIHIRKGELMPGEEKKSRKNEKVGLTSLLGRISDGLKSLTDIGVLDDLSAILRSISRNKDYLLTLVEKSYSFSVATNQVWVDHRDEIERMLSGGEKLLSAFSADSEALAGNVSQLTSDMAKVAGGLENLVSEAGALLPEAKGAAQDARGLMAEALSLAPAARDLMAEVHAAISEVNGILPGLAETAEDAAVLAKEAREIVPAVKEMLPLLKEILTGASGLVKEAEGLVPKIQRSLDTLNRNLPKLDRMDGRSIKKFFQEEGVMIYLKKPGFLK